MTPESSDLPDDAAAADIEALWIAEVESRLAAFQTGTMGSIGADEVFAELLHRNDAE